MKANKTGAGIRTLSGRRNTSVAVLKFLYLFMLRFAPAAALSMIIAVCLPVIKAAASSCNITFSSSSDEIKVDEMVTVELTITGDVVPGIFEGYVSYNAEVLEYVSGPECIAGGEGTLRISDMGYGSTTLSRKYVMEFKGVKRGNSDISMRGNPEIYEADLGYLMSISANKLTVEVKAANRASSDASLGLIRINPGVLTPEFSRDRFEYTVQVPYEVTEVYVSAAPNQSEASVKIEGDTKLNVGQNRILILVTAEDGTLGKYVIYVARAQENDVAGQNEPEVQNGDEGSGSTDPGNSTQDDTGSDRGWMFYAEEDDEGIFINADTRYKVTKNTQNIDIPEGYNKTSIMISGHTITAYAPSGNPGSDYLLLVLEKEGSQPALYCFDRNEKTIQRLNMERIVMGSKTGSGYSTIDEEELVKSYEKSLGTMTMVIAILSGVCMLLLIIVIRMALRNKNEID